MNLKDEFTAIGAVMIFAVSMAFIAMYAGAGIIVGVAIAFACIVFGFLFWELEKYKRSKY